MDKYDKNLSLKRFAISPKYTAVQLLGKGTYGSVYRAIHSDTKEVIAIKIIKLDVESEGVPSTALREIAILKKTNHINIVRIKELQLCDTKIEVGLEYMPMDLRSFIEQNRKDTLKYNSKTIKIIMYQILKGIEFLHSKKILHRDLKPHNVLINDKTLETKIADFGLSRVYTIPLRAYTKEVLTLWYRAPELMLGLNQYSIGLDMWSIGCIMAEMYNYKPLFGGDSEIDQLYRIFKVFGTPDDEKLPGYKFFPDMNKDFPKWKAEGFMSVLGKSVVKLDADALDLLENMMRIDPCKRISCKEALTHVSVKCYMGCFYKWLFIDL